MLFYEEYEWGIIWSVSFAFPSLGFCRLIQVERGSGWFMQQHQMASAGFATGLVLGGLSFMVLQNSTSWPGTSANTLFANASFGACGNMREQIIRRSQQLWNDGQELMWTKTDKILIGHTTVSTCENNKYRWTIKATCTIEGISAALGKETIHLARFCVFNPKVFYWYVEMACSSGRRQTFYECSDGEDKERASTRSSSWRANKCSWDACHGSVEQGVTVFVRQETAWESYMGLKTKYMGYPYEELGSWGGFSLSDPKKDATCWGNSARTLCERAWLGACREIRHTDESGFFCNIFCSSGYFEESPHRHAQKTPVNCFQFWKKMSYRSPLKQQISDVNSLRWGARACRRNQRKRKANWIYMIR